MTLELRRRRHCDKQKLANLFVGSPGKTFCYIRHYSARRALHLATQPHVLLPSGAFIDGSVDRFREVSCVLPTLEILKSCDSHRGLSGLFRLFGASAWSAQPEKLDKPPNQTNRFRTQLRPLTYMRAHKETPSSSLEREAGDLREVG